MIPSVSVTPSSHSSPSRSIAPPEDLPAGRPGQAVHGGLSVEVAAATAVELEELRELHAAPAPSVLAGAPGASAPPAVEATDAAAIAAELGADDRPAAAEAATATPSRASAQPAAGRPHGSGIPPEPEAGAGAATRPSWSRRLLRQVDVYAVTTRADDRALRRDLNTQGSTVRVAEREVEVSVAALRQRLGEYRQDIERYRATLPAHRARRLERVTTDLLNSLDTIEHGRPRAGLFSRAAALFLLCAPIPVAVPYSLGENQYAAIMTASYTKTAIMLVGLLLNEFADERALWHHFNQRHLVNLALSVPYMIPAYLSRIKGLEGLESLQENPYFNTGVALTAAGAFLYRSYPDAVRAGYRRIESAVRKAYRGGAGLVNAAAAHFGSMPPIRPPEALVLSEEMRQVYADLLARVRQDRKALATLRDRYTFDKTGKSMSSIANRKLGDMENDYRLLEKEIEALFPELAEQMGDKSANPELVPKLAFGILTFVVCSAATALMWPDTLGVLDMGVDDVGVSAYMFALAFLSSANVQDMEDAFRSFVGMSALAIVFLGTNKLMMLTGTAESDKGFMDTAEDRAIGTVTLDLANLTLPGPLGYGGAAGIRRLLEALMGPASAGATAADDEEENAGQDHAAVRAAATHDAQDDEPGGALRQPASATGGQGGQQ